MFGIMCNIMDMETGHMKREIFLYSRKDSDFGNTLDGLVEFMKKSDILKAYDWIQDEEDDWRLAYCKVGNESVSRKKFEIVFRDYYQ